eukprot:1150041-Pelagomonas_calceolata.AAC.1
MRALSAHCDRHLHLKVARPWNKVDTLPATMTLPTSLATSVSAHTTACMIALNYSIKPDDDDEAGEQALPSAPSQLTFPPTEDEQLEAAIAASKREHEEEQRRRWAELEASKHTRQAAGGAEVGGDSGGSGSKSDTAGADAGGIGSSGSGSRDVRSNGGANGGMGSGVSCEGGEGGRGVVAAGASAGGAEPGRCSAVGGREEGFGGGAPGHQCEMGGDELFDEELDADLLRAIELSKQDQGPRSQAPLPQQLDGNHREGQQPSQLLHDQHPGDQAFHQQQQQQEMPPPRQKQRQWHAPGDSGEEVKGVEGAQGGGSGSGSKRTRRELRGSLGASSISHSLSGDSRGGARLEVGGSDAEEEGEEGAGAGKKTKHTHSPVLAAEIKGSVTVSAGRAALQEHGAHTAGQQHSSHQ